MMLLVVYGAPVLAIVTGYNEPPRSRSVLGIGLLVLGLSALLAMALAAPLLGEKGSTVAWRLAFVVGGIPYLWKLGVEIVVRANAVGNRVSDSRNSSARTRRVNT